MTRSFSLFVCLLILSCLLTFPTKAQVTSGYMGKKNVLSIGAALPVSEAEIFPLYVPIEFSRVLTRQLSVGLGMRPFSVNRVEPVNQTARLKGNIWQYSVFVEINSRKDWQMAPLGFRHKLGVAVSSMKYNIIRYVSIASSAEQNALGLSSPIVGESGDFSWNSVFYEIHFRRPIWKTICFDIGAGLELPIIQSNQFKEEQLVLQQAIKDTNSSRAFCLGVSYVF